MNVMRSIGGSRNKILEDSSTSFIMTSLRQHQGTPPSPPPPPPPPPRELLLPCFHIDEVKPGRYIDSGKYTSTFEVSSIVQNHKVENMRHQWARDLIDKDGRRKRRSSNMVGGGGSSSGGGGSEKRLCIKYIRQEYMDSHDEFESAATNLANDAQMMSALNHKNIAKLRGCSLDGTEAYYKTGRYDGYFLLVDRIHETLEERICKWRSRNQWLRMQRRAGCLSEKTEKEFLVERLQCAFDLADALDYMHEHGIAHMNLNERTVGFTAKGDLQVYELGDAVPVTSSSYYSCELDAAEQSPTITTKQAGARKRNNRKQRTSYEVQQPQDDDCTAFVAEDIFCFTRILCEILVLRPKAKGLPPSIVNTNEDKSTIRAFRKLSQVIPSELLHLLQRGLSLKGQSASTASAATKFTAASEQREPPTMAEYRSVLGDVLSSLDKESYVNSPQPGFFRPRKTHFKLPVVPVSVIKAAAAASSGNIGSCCHSSGSGSPEDETFHSSFGEAL